nr:hypothetical protein [Tanacetum cinerariifolium]
RPMRFEDLYSWDLDKTTWGGRAKLFGTIQVVVRCTGKLVIVWFLGDFCTFKHNPYLHENYVESVGPSFLRVILIGSISVEVSIATELEAAAVASPARSDTEIPERHVSPTSSTSEILTDPILTAPSAIVAPSSEFPLALVVASLGIRRRRAIPIQPRKDIPIGRLYRTHPGRPCKALTVRKSVRPLPSHRLALSEVYLCWRSAPLSTMYPLTTFESLAGDSSKSSAGSSCKRCKSPAATRFRDSISPEDSVEEDIDTDMLEDIEADDTAIEVAVDRDVEAGINTYIDMEVDVEDEVKSSDRGTMKRIEDIETGQRELEVRSMIAGGERAGLLVQVTSLKWNNTRL